MLVHLHREGRPELDALLRRVGGRPGLKLVVDVLLATGLSAADLSAAIAQTGAAAETRASARTTRTTSGCPSCGSVDLLKCANEQQCRTCGTRFDGSRILFSFDEQSGYIRWRARANGRRLAEARERVRAICAEYLAADRTIAREPVLRSAGIPQNSIPHLSRRAGLVAIIAQAQQRQRDARIRLARGEADRIDPSELELRRRVEIMALARAIGVAAACKRLGVVRSRYYRWREAFKRGGIAALRATCRPRGFEVRLVPDVVLT